MKYEYKVLTLDYNADIQAAIDEYAADGWRLATFAITDSHCSWVIMERPAPA